MFEGKHIHFSPIDQKPLCSFSTKLCRQRRLNGFAFCIRHILEDPSAPFQVCTFVAPPGQNKCTNVISIAHPKGLCNTHLQLAGYPAAKRDRRGLKKEDSQRDTSSPTGKMSSQSNDPTSSSMELSDDPYTFSDDTEPTTKPEPILCSNLKKPSTDTNNTNHHNSPLTVEPLTPSSTSSSSVDGHMDHISSVCKNSYMVPQIPSNGFKIKAVKLSAATADSKPKLGIVVKKKKLLSHSGVKSLTASHQNHRPLPAMLQQLDDLMRRRKSRYLLPDPIDDSEEEEEPTSIGGLARLVSTIPHRSSVFGTPRVLKLERSKKEFRHRYLQLAEMLNVEDKFQGERQRELANKLIEATRRWPNETALILQERNPSPLSASNPKIAKIFSKRRCSFRRSVSNQTEGNTGCPEFCLPCSTLCSRHILYSVDQQLFEFCSARAAAGPTPCGAPVLAIHSGLPYCAAHIGQKEQSGSTSFVSSSSTAVNRSDPLSPNSVNKLGQGSSSSSSSKSVRRKSRSTSSLGRHSRRLRNRRRAKRIGGSSETRVHCIEAADNGMELDVETVDSPENCSPAYPTPAQLTPHMNVIPPMAPAAPVDHEAEILEDHDLKELLNRLPDEAFQEIFAMTQAAASSSRNGGLFVPSREEAEELERALACGEGVPMMDKYGNSLGGVGQGGESDLGDLSLIDDHTLALAHDLMNLGSGAAVQNLMMNSDPSAVSNHMYMENLSISHPSMIHPGYNTEEFSSSSSSPMMSRRKGLSVVSTGYQASPARGSSPPSLNQQHVHDSNSYEIERDSAAHLM